ncbi:MULTISPECIES: tight adherence pilus pseudopilin TadF [unclassified Gilliamella]|uniref:tight adherence pilus pseudopilin TadF n=1 Tax=unclassified Gilliamella TaxID=2685620 RepID=UPI00080ECDCA|nr:tight adherence pilus pseudopilin TadF [Gilliamella apicola]OCG22547.1 hypothetical protein A9G23_02620 [Gilliamella apicola]OCG23698.1 hypothetical protein A9G22_05615 [Gilliamella apicola]
MKYFGNFFRNKDGMMSIEFAASFCLFSALVFIIYDVYSTIMLQNKLERANYAVASIFRERSAFYPVIDGTNNHKISLCHSNPSSCHKSYELFDDAQVQELEKLATSLLDSEVVIKVDALFILQNVEHPKSLNHAKLVALSSESCSSGICNNTGIRSYFDSLPSITENLTNSAIASYSDLAPYAPRFIDTTTGLDGRWIPIYRVSMCIVNEESLYLKWINSNRKATDTFPNLCSNTVVISRCNDITNVNTACPIYHR